MAWLPNDKIGVMVLTNYSGSNPTTDLVARYVYDALLGLDHIDWTARAREQQKKGEAAGQEARKKAAAERKTGTSLSHPIEEYAGRYENPAYGRAEVQVNGSALRMSVVGLAVPLEHFHYDMFAAPAGLSGPEGMFSGRLVTFFYSKKGEIDRIAIPLEPAVDDIVFTRVVEKPAP